MVQPCRSTLTPSLLALALACTQGDGDGPSAPAPELAVARGAATAPGCDPADPGVSAHAAHAGTPARAALACSECHAPTGGACAPGQTVAFGSLARSGGATPVWDAATATCSGGASTCGSGGVAAPGPVPRPSTGDAAGSSWSAPRWGRTRPATRC